MQLQLPEPSGPAAINNARLISTWTHELPSRSLQFESCSASERADFVKKVFHQIHNTNLIPAEELENAKKWLMNANLNLPPELRIDQPKNRRKAKLPEVRFCVPKLDGLPVPKKQKKFKLWENDELLGMNSTFAMILFANEKYPELKHQYPNWSDRIEVISWYWNQVDSDTSTAYFEKAAKNRENQRRKNSVHSNKIQGITNVFPSSTSQSNVTSKSTENLLIKSENDLYINPADYTFSSEEVKIKQEEVKLEPIEESIKTENDV